MSDRNTTILNDLIATTIDSVHGYQDAAEDATNMRFASIFRERAEERRGVAAQLRAEVRRLGEEPEDDGTLLAGAQRMFMGIKDAITGTDDEAIIAEVERGEDHIKAKFEDAIQNDDLDGACRQTVENCYSSIKSGHDQMSRLKSQTQAS